MTAVQLRTATERDQPFLTDALLLAYNWTGQDRFTREELLADPNAAHYVTGWPKPGEFGVLAEDLATRAPVGAAWARLLPADDPGYGYVAPDVPELTLGVVPGWRGCGLGKALLDALLAAAREHGHRRISLSVEDGNRAVELYRSRGFVPVGRVGGADTMVRELRPRAPGAGAADRGGPDGAAPRKAAGAPPFSAAAPPRASATPPRSWATTAPARSRSAPSNCGAPPVSGG